MVPPPTAVSSLPDEKASLQVRKRRTPEEAGFIQCQSALVPTLDNKISRSASKVAILSSIEEEKRLARETSTGFKFKWDRPVAPINLFFLIILTGLAFLSRLYKLSVPNFVLWDEAHFGKFGSYYLRRMYYFDVHPPLGKMLVALGGWLAKVDGAYEFPSGQTYPEGFNYVAMRMFVAIFGTLSVPFTYLLALQTRLSPYAAYLCGLMALFDNGLIVITRLILLDSFLLCFTSLTALCYAWFRNQGERPFSRKWWISLCATGLGIGCVASVKWVGFFVTALVGFNTIDELWTMFGDSQMSRQQVARHFLARVFGLIVIPISIYIVCFRIHFLILNRSGPGDANMSSLFQAGLYGNKLHLSPLEVAYGSVVTIKSNSYGGGLLHSHVQGYPSGSKQQQVTTYHHKDQNNDWVMVKTFEDPAELSKEDDPPRRVKHGEVVRIKHAATRRFLHSHQIPAPITAGDFEVSTYGGDEYPDPNDLWVIELVKDANGKVTNGSILKSLSTTFRLRHKETGCYLKARNVQLPEWGFKQGEVTCDRASDPMSKFLLWNIETNVNDKLPPGEVSNYKSRFWDNFRDCNVGMYLTNNALVPDPELEPSILTSSAKDWVFMRKGIRLSGWDNDRIKFYMLGNPAVWLTSTAAILILASLLGIYQLLIQRKVYNWLPVEYGPFKYRLKLITGGWALHYFPFFLMGRVLYLHHYYPALLFAIVNVGIVYDFCMVRMKAPQQTQQVVFGCLVLMVMATFWYFSPMAYGITGPAEEFHGRKWFKSWNL